MGAVPTIESIATSLEEGSFFATHAQSIYKLFVALDREQEWSDSPQDLVPYTQSNWVGEEHGKSGKKDYFNANQEAAALDVLEEMGMIGEIKPPAGVYEQAVIIGGLLRVNRERVAFVKDHIETGSIAINKVVFWAGQRLRDRREDAQLDSIDMNKLQHDDWLEAELKKPREPGWNSRFATEAELARLAYLEQHPDAILEQRVETRTGSLSGIPQRDIAAFSFRSDDFPDFEILNCQAVNRPMGLPRHTTASSAREWLELTPPSQNAKVLLVAGNPHIRRAYLEVKQVAQAAGREDIELLASGTIAHPLPSTRLYLGLGEIGRLLYQETMTV